LRLQGRTTTGFRMAYEELMDKSSRRRHDAYLKEVSERPLFPLL